MDRPAASNRLQTGATDNELFDLFMTLEASDAQLDFPILYASAKAGWVTSDPEKMQGAIDATNAGSGAGFGMEELLQEIIDKVPPPTVAADKPFAMTSVMMSYDSFVGQTVTGQIESGTVSLGDRVHALRQPESADDSKAGSVSATAQEGTVRCVGRVTKLRSSRQGVLTDVTTAAAGDIIGLAGLDDVQVSDTISSVGNSMCIPSIPIDPPTLSMVFGANDSPLGGKEGKFCTSSMILKVGSALVRTHTNPSSPWPAR